MWNKSTCILSKCSSLTDVNEKIRPVRPRRDFAKSIISMWCSIKPSTNTIELRLSNSGFHGDIATGKYHNFNFRQLQVLHQNGLEEPRPRMPVLAWIRELSADSYSTRVIEQKYVVHDPPNWKSVFRLTVNHDILTDFFLLWFGEVEWCCSSIALKVWFFFFSFSPF